MHPFSSEGLLFSFFELQQGHFASSNPEIFNNQQSILNNQTFSIRTSSLKLQTSSRPPFSIQAPVVNCFSQMLHLNIITAGKIGDSAAHFENAIISACR